MHLTTMMWEILCRPMDRSTDIDTVAGSDVNTSISVTESMRGQVDHHCQATLHSVQWYFNIHILHVIFPKQIAASLHTNSVTTGNSVLVAFSYWVYHKDSDAHFMHKILDPVKDRSQLPVW